MNVFLLTVLRDRSSENSTSGSVQLSRSRGKEIRQIGGLHSCGAPIWSDGEVPIAHGADHRNGAVRSEDRWSPSSSGLCQEHLIAACK